MLGFGDAARGGHQQGPAEVGGGLGQHVGRVGGDDARGGQRRHVEVVVAHRHVAHRAQRRQRGDQACVDAVGGVGQHAGLAGQPGLQRGGIEHRVLLVVVDIEILRQAVDHFGIDGAGDKDGRLHGITRGRKGRS
ncbi:hypothetical protein D9M70_594760 [compost metagenome]